MEKLLDVQDVLDSIRENDQQLEQLIADLKREEKPSDKTRSDDFLAITHSLFTGQGYHFQNIPG